MSDIDVGIPASIGYDVDNDVWVEHGSDYDRYPRDAYKHASRQATHTLVAEVNQSDQAEDNFFRRNPVAVRGQTSKSYNLKNGPNRISKWFLSQLTDVVRVRDGQFVWFEGFYEGKPVFATISWRTETDEVAGATIKVDSTLEIAEKFGAILDAAFAADHEPMAKWWYQGDHGVDAKQIYLPRSGHAPIPELYPDMGDPDAYLEAYLDSNASVLMMIGPPGTGKTTLLRHLITKHRLYSHIVYDEGLMRSDKVFQSFLFDSQSDIMVIEDADTLLADRERDGNKMMSRFLNVSDGLIKLPNKKLVFTTNLTDVNKVDAALLRPGRCFGVLHTRALNLTEAQAAARACNLPIPTQKQEYTLGELFNRGQGTQVRRVGFGAG